jgi:hypothetical protein
MGAAFGLGLVFSDFYLDFGQIENLAHLKVAGFHIFQASVTTDALPDPMHFDAVRIGYHFQSMPGMSWLTTAFPTVAFAQALGRRFVQAIAGGRFTTIVAILGQTIFECIDSGC